MPVIQIQHLKKNYGNHMGIRDVTFSVEEGEIFGFVGPNGAGKSTTLRVLMGFLYPSGGSASLCGLDTARDSKRIKAFTGYVPSDVRLYAHMRVGELLRRNAAFYRGGDLRETQRLCALFEVDTGKRLRELSSGNQKKVSILCALQPAPKVILLDEPTNSLDPVMRKILFGELKKRAAQGTTVLLSSHNLAEVQEYCGRVAFIKDGSIVAVTGLGEGDAPGKKITVTGGGLLPAGLELVRQEGPRRVLRSALGSAALLDALAALAPEDFTVENESMEERFWSLYQEEERR